MIIRNTDQLYLIMFHAIVQTLFRWENRRIRPRTDYLRKTRETTQLQYKYWYRVYSQKIWHSEWVGGFYHQVDQTPIIHHHVKATWPNQEITKETGNSIIQEQHSLRQMPHLSTWCKWMDYVRLVICFHHHREPLTKRKHHKKVNWGHTTTDRQSNSHVCCYRIRSIECFIGYHHVIIRNTDQLFFIMFQTKNLQIARPRTIWLRQSRRTTQLHDNSRD